MISKKLKNLVDPNNESCCEHSLAHKCKEWAVRYRYLIHSFPVDTNREVNNSVCHWQTGIWFTDWQTSDYNETHATDAETEPEAIFLACQWVLDKGE